MKRRKIAWTVLVLCGIIISAAEAQGPPGANMPPPEVACATVKVSTVPVSYEYVGLTEASKTVEIRARVQGFIETRDFQEGAYIEEGARLFTIDPRSFKADREIAKAQVEQAEARLQLAEQEVKRMQSVRRPGAIAPADLDQKIAEQSSAAAALRLAKAQLAKADLEVSYTVVAAPLTGYVGKAQKEIGSLVDASQNSLLTVMQQVDPLYVSFPVSETDFLAWRRQEREGELVLPQGDSALRVEITLYDGTAFGEAGVLDFENVELNKQKGTVEMRATFPNRERALKPGQFVTVLLKGWERPNTMAVPQRAVSQSPEGPYVYVLGSGNTVERRAIKVGKWSGPDWVILDGLKEGEQVIVEGLTKIRPGMTVTPVAGSGEEKGASGSAAEAGTAAAARAPFSESAKEQ